ncbi:MAG TPA: topoisomerase DNA-binding C4 zinc finger domain-containing protein, partial [Thermoplasmata archaeon]|nr:topoisomerase DNA-binding C4 zinc finger domain-containing protein [Thermoplasmata archaeon]
PGVREDLGLRLLGLGHELLARNAEGVRSTLTTALDSQHFVGPCARCGGALRMARSPRGSRWVQCVNNPGSCTASYALPSAGFIEPAPEFLCGTCKVPRVRIVFRGQRPDLYCINPECAEHHKAFRIGVCPNCGSPLAIRYSFRGNRFVGCTGYPKCTVTYPLPQRGKLEKDQPPCPTCHAPVVTAIEAGRPPWTLCINPECPTRAESKARSAARVAKRAAGAARRRTPVRRKTGSTPPTEAAVEGGASVPEAPPAEEKGTAVPKAKRRAPPKRPSTSPPTRRRRTVSSSPVPP